MVNPFTATGGSISRGARPPQGPSDREPAGKGNAGGNGDSFQEAMKRGSTHGWKGRWERAVEEYRRALQYSPKDPSARTYLAMALYKSGQLQEALELYEELWKEQPSNPALLQRLAEVQESMGDLEAAATSHQRLAEVFTRRRSLEEAFEAWQKALALKPGDLALWDSMMEAAALVGAVDKMMPSYLGLARRLALESHFEEAIGVVERGQILDPSNSLTLPLLASIRGALAYSWRATAQGETPTPEDLARLIPAISISEQPPPRAGEPPAPPVVPDGAAEFQEDLLVAEEVPAETRGSEAVTQEEPAAIVEEPMTLPQLVTEGASSDVESLEEEPASPSFPGTEGTPSLPSSYEEEILVSDPATDEQDPPSPPLADEGEDSSLPPAFGEMDEEANPRQQQWQPVEPQPSEQWDAPAAAQLPEESPVESQPPEESPVDAEARPPEEEPAEVAASAEVEPIDEPRLPDDSKVAEPLAEQEVAEIGGQEEPDLAESQEDLDPVEAHEGSDGSVAEGTLPGIAIAGQLAELAEAYEQAGQVEQAAETYGEALGLSPDLPRALLGMARLHLAVGELDLAEEKVRRALLSPVSEEGVTQRSAAKLLLDILIGRAVSGDLAAATEGLLWLRSTVPAELLPASEEAAGAPAFVQLLGWCGAEHLEELALLPPEVRGEAVLALREAEELLESGQLRSAADEMYRLIAAHSDFLPAQSLLGKVLAAQSRLEEARERSQRLLDLYDMRGYPDQALEVLWWRVALEAGNGDDRARLVQLLRVQNRVAEAEAVESGRRIDAWVGEMGAQGWDELLRRAEISFAEGAREDAVDLLRTALAVDGADQVTRAALTRVLQTMGDEVSREELLEILKQLDLPEGLAQI